MIQHILIGEHERSFVQLIKPFDQSLQRCIQKPCIKIIYDCVVIGTYVWRRDIKFAYLHRALAKGTQTYDRNLCDPIKFGLLTLDKKSLQCAAKKTFKSMVNTVAQ